MNTTALLIAILICNAITMIFIVPGVIMWVAFGSYRRMRDALLIEMAYTDTLLLQVWEHLTIKDTPARDRIKQERTKLSAVCRMFEKEHKDMYRL